MTLPCGIFSKYDNYTTRHWKRIQFLANLSWQRWSKEYLIGLQERQKWLRPSRNVEIGNIVFVLDGAVRNCW